MTRTNIATIGLCAALAVLAVPNTGRGEPKKKPVTQADIDRLEKKIADQQRMLEKLVKLQQQYLQQLVALLPDPGVATPTQVASVDEPKEPPKPVAEAK